MRTTIIAVMLVLVSCCAYGQEIATVNDLAGITGDGDYTLTQDITLPEDWTPSDFRGTFDGGNHTITAGSPVFGTLRGTVKALKVTGTVSREGNAGGIALELRGGKIEGCTFTGSVEGRKSGDDTHADTGGIVAVMRSGDITGCTFSGNVSVNGITYPRAGGITALMYAGNITGCSVSADSVITSGGSSAIAGGIAGQVNVSPDMGISDCVFSGQVSSTRYAGGIAGHMRGGKLSGNMTASGAKVSGADVAGGIVGSSDMCAVLDNEAYAEVSGTLQGGIIGKASSAGTISGNKYSGAQWGIGEYSDGRPGNEGCVNVSAEESGETTEPDTETPSGQDTEEEERTAERTEAGNSSGGGGGGCNSGMGFIGLAVVFIRGRFFVS